MDICRQFAIVTTSGTRRFIIFRFNTVLYHNFSRIYTVFFLFPPNVMFSLVIPKLNPVLGPSGKGERTKMERL